MCGGGAGGFGREGIAFLQLVGGFCCVDGLPEVIDGGEGHLQRCVSFDVFGLEGDLKGLLQRVEGAKTAWMHGDGKGILRLFWRFGGLLGLVVADGEVVQQDRACGFEAFAPDAGTRPVFGDGEGMLQFCPRGVAPA